MATEKTCFDDWLKDRLYRDIVYRFALVASVSSLATYFALVRRSIPALRYFSQLTDSVAPLVNTFGSFGAALCVLAMMLKDLEVLSSNDFGQESLPGKLGGVVRRVAGDISLWTFGALTAMVIAASVAAVSASATVSNALSLLLPYFLSVALLIGTGIANFFVRRKEPSPWHTIFRSPFQAVIAYGTVLSIQLVEIFM